MNNYFEAFLELNGALSNIFHSVGKLLTEKWPTIYQSHTNFKVDARTEIDPLNVVRATFQNSQISRWESIPGFIEKSKLFPNTKASTPPLPHPFYEIL